MAPSTPTAGSSSSGSSRSHAEQRARQRARRRAKHRSYDQIESFSRSFAALGFVARNGVQVSARVTDLATGDALLSIDDYVVMPTASVGKVLLLIEVATRLDDPDFAALTILERDSADVVSQAGVWQHLQASAFHPADLAAFIGASGDNLATNVLLRHVGLDAVRFRAEGLGLKRTALLDIARDQRGPDDAPHLSVASMRELTWLLSGLAHGEIVDQKVSQRVAGWLSLNSDLSLVGSSFGLDPFSHRAHDHGIQLFNSTGTDSGVRADAGVVRGPRAGATYAVAMSFSDTELPVRLAVVDAMRTIGNDVLEYIY
ncbi:serine hydrolase [Okibacterium endophyticum]